MKTAEEEARDFLTGEGAKYPLPKAVSIFANAKAKALLEEGIKECDFWMNSPSEGEFEKGMDYGCKTIKEKLSSLILK